MGAQQVPALCAGGPALLDVRAAAGKDGRRVALEQQGAGRAVLGRRGLLREHPAQARRQPVASLRALTCSVECLSASRLGPAGPLS